MTAVDEALASVTPWRPRIALRRPEPDLVAAEQAAADLMRALGLDLEDEHLADTPGRFARAMVELTSGPEFELTTFPNDDGYDELVLVADVPVHSICEHHLLPFSGVAHVGYLPGERILGLSKFARMVELHARRPQTQERLTITVARHLDQALRPRGVGVVVEAEHSCMSLRGARAPGARTTTSALLGQLREDARSRAEFLSLTRRSSCTSS